MYTSILIFLTVVASSLYIFTDILSAYDPRWFFLPAALAYVGRLILVIYSRFSVSHWNQYIAERNIAQSTSAEFRAVMIGVILQLFGRSLQIDTEDSPDDIPPPGPDEAQMSGDDEEDYGDNTYRSPMDMEEVSEEDASTLSPTAKEETVEW